MTATQLIQRHGSKVVSGALIVALYVTVVAAGWFLAYLPAQASPLLNVSDTLSVSVPSSISVHTLVFKVASAGTVGENDIRITFTGFTGQSGITTADVSVTGTSTGAFGIAAVADSGDELDIDVDEVFVSGETITVVVGGAGLNNLTNPAASTGVLISILTSNQGQGNTLDTGSTFVAIQDQVTLQASVADVVSFIIRGVSAGTSLDDGGDTADVTSTATLVPFGTLTAETPIMGASSLSFTSNATNGFVVTVEQNHDMTASSGADIDCFADNDGSCGSAGEQAWKSPSATNGQEDTYGHLGLYTEDGTTDDITTTASISSGTTGTFFGLSGTTPIQVWKSSTTGDGLTQDTGSINVIYRIEISGLQESGTYTNQLMYIATVTF